MADLSHQWGADLEIGPAGDLRISAATEYAQQRVLRRLLTNPGDYIWNIDYGAGLGRYIGQPADPRHVQALAGNQLLLEPTVAFEPEPVIRAYGSAMGAGCTFHLEVRFRDTSSGEDQLLLVPLNH